MSDYQTIRVSAEGAVTTIALARPDKMNALTPRLFTEMTAAIDAAIAANCRALVLTGEGKAFCSGADLRGEGEDEMPDDPSILLESHYNPFSRKIAGLGVPIITAVNGPAVGAGMSLALLGDMVVMARSAYLLLAFVNIGLVPDAGGTWLVTKSVGRARALEMALLGERISAEAALAAGLINRVAEDGDALTQAQAIAAKLAAGPPIAIGIIRKQVAAALTSTLDETLEMERVNQKAAGATRDFKEALAAFAEKRPPRFEGA